MTGVMLAALWFLGTAAPCFAAPPRQIRFARVSVEEGLSQAGANTIFQDSTGFLWIATQAGLDRYDGRRFTTFVNDADEPDSIAHNWVWQMLEEPSGDILMATHGGGLNRWSRSTGRFERLRHDPDDPASLADDRLRNLLLDDDGPLWVGTEETGLDRGDPATGVFEHFRHDPDDPESLGGDKVRALLRDRAGRLWVGTHDGGLSLYRPETGTFRRFVHDPKDPASLPHDTVRALLEDSGSNLWVATYGGLARLDTDSWRFENLAHDPTRPRTLSDNRVTSLLEDSAGRLWVGTEHGLNLFDAASGTFTRYLHDPGDASSLSDGRVIVLYEDRGGVLWAGTAAGGLNKWAPRTWAFSNDPVRPRGLQSNVVLALALEDQKTLWIGTSGGGLSRLDRRSGELTTFRHDPDDPRSLADDRVTTLHFDRRGNFWVGTVFGGLHRLAPATGTFQRYPYGEPRPDSLGAAGVTFLFEDSRDRLWLGTYDGGLSLIDRATDTFRHWRHVPSDPSSLSNDRVLCAAEAPDGALWLGTLGGGINRFEPTSGGFERVRHRTGVPGSLSSDSVHDLLFDHQDRLWVGTAAGLNRLESSGGDPGRAVFRRYGPADGLPSDLIYALLPDDRGGVWVSTNKGLARYHPATDSFRAYDASHGLQGPEFNLGASFRAPSGELFFGGINGLNSFFPERIRDNPEPPPVVLTGITRLDQPMRFDRPVAEIDRVTLSHTDDLIAVEFAALDYTDPGRNRYRYRLEGLNESWVDLGARSQVTFTHLDPGRYTLHVQGANSDGVWNEEGLALRLVIPPPLWQTWWFRAILVAAAVALVLSTIALRTRAVRRRNTRLEHLIARKTSELETAQEKLLRQERLAILGELAGSVAHELRNPLGAIRNSAYFLKLTLGSVGDKPHEHLRLIEAEIERSNGIITELLDFGRGRDPRFRTVDLQEVVDRTLRGFRLPEGIVLERIESPEPLEVEIDPDQIERALVNLLRNAVQAMDRGGRLEVGCEARDKQAAVTVADSGPGIPEENLGRIFEPLFTDKAKGIGLGLPVSLRYANLNRGSIEVENEPGGGAVFRLVLPLAAASSAPEGAWPG